MLFAIVAFNETAVQGIILYAIAYSVATIGIFSILLKLKDYTFEGYNGLGRTQPLLALANTVFLLSLAGIPLTAGFFAKYFLLSAVVQQGNLLWLVILGVLCAAISAYYYFRVIMAMYFKPGEAATTAPITGGFKSVLVVAVAIVIILGIFPNLVLQFL